MRHYAKRLGETLTVLLILAAAAGAAIAGSFEDGYAAYNGGDYVTALWLLRPLVDQGNADAEDMLGVMYFVGQGVTQNRAEAIRLYRLAAEQGNAHAQNSLAFAYFDGVEVR